MSNYIKEYVRISDHASLDEVIDALSAIRRSIPDGAQAELRMRGDDVFGRHMCVCYMRPKPSEELLAELPYRLSDVSTRAA